MIGSAGMSLGGSGCDLIRLLERELGGFYTAVILCAKGELDMWEGKTISSKCLRGEDNNG